MLKRPKCPVIALEEHYWDKEIASQFVGAEGTRNPEMLKRLYDLGERRRNYRLASLALRDRAPQTSRRRYPPPLLL